MFERTDARRPDDLFLPMSERSPRGVYFVRVCGWNESIKDVVWRCCETAIRRGVLIDGGLQNPNEMQLGYMNDVLGQDFKSDEMFIHNALIKCLPAMKDESRRDFAKLLSAQFEAMQGQGKSESVLKNLYVKLMCWLYYRFNRLMPLLGENDPPRMLITCPDISAHELIMLRLLCSIGADVMLMVTSGNAAYLKYDPESRLSQLLFPGAAAFPQNFSLKELRREMSVLPAKSRPSSKPSESKPAAVQPRLAPKPVDPLSYFPKPSHDPYTNAWIREADYNAILTPVVSRGENPATYCNAFIRLTGVRDKLTFPGELHQFYQRCLAAGRQVVIVDEGLQLPSPEEIAKIRRRTYSSADEMIIDLANNLPISANSELQRMLQRAFVETMIGAKAQENALNRLLVSAVYLLCWIRRWHRELFQDYKSGNMPCFVLMQGCKNAQEALYPVYLSWLPVDVLIVAPDLNRPCILRDNRLLELKGEESLCMNRFPRDAGSFQVRTVASHAEQELNEMLYQDSGMFRNMQFQRAEVMTLHTTYDELFLLWEQELKYRSGFSADEKVATMPVIYAKISGVENGDTTGYWLRVKQLMEHDAFVCRGFPMIQHNAANPFQPLALKALREGVLRRSVLKEDRMYPFGIIREEMQEHILDKIQLILDRRLIRGIFENGTEYAVISTILNMDKKLVRMLQSFDFTKRNPKAVYIATDDRMASLEDAILLTFLNLVGFDIALFVPTGYQIIERYLSDNLPVEHQAGEYMYELIIPDLDMLPRPRKRTWLDNLFKRGN